MVDARMILALAEAADAARAENDEAAEAGLQASAGDIAPAIDYLLEHDLAAALRLVGALPGYWQDAGRVEEGRELTERAVKLGQRSASSDRGVAAAITRALLAASELAFRQGDQRMATKRARDAIRAAILIEDRPSAALAHTDLARVAYRDGDAARIEKHARKALELAGDDALARRGALHMLAWAAHTAGDLDEAERRFEASLAYRREVGSRLSVAAEIGNLGDLAAERGDLGRAARLLSEALSISHEIGSRYMLVNTLPSFAVLAARARLDEEAAQLFGAGESVAASAGLVPDPNPSIEEHRDAVRRRLGSAEFGVQLATGTALSPDDAVALALAVGERISAADSPA